MTDITPILDGLETRLMQAWLERDRSFVKAHLAGDCVIMFGTAPPVLLDRASFLAGMEKGLALTGFRFREVTARQYDRLGWFTGHVELELELGHQRWNGGFLLTDLWRRTRIPRRWRLAERSLAAVEPSEALSDAIRRLQLWR